MFMSNGHNELKFLLGSCSERRGEYSDAYDVSGEKQRSQELRTHSLNAIVTNCASAAHSYARRANSARTIRLAE